jgi:GNAT superfamily N-acetyltransferase
MSTADALRMMADPPGRLLRMRRSLLRRERIVVMDIDATTVDSWPEHDHSAVAVRAARAEDLPGLTLLLPDEDLTGRMAAGDLCMVADDEGRVVGCSWMAMGPIRAPHWRMIVRPGPREAYCYGLVVAPESRRRGVGRDLVQAIRREGRRRGVERFLTHIGAHNKAALSLQRTSGSRELRRLYALVLLDHVCLVVATSPAAA